MDERLKKMGEDLIAGRTDVLKQAIAAALSDGIAAKEILDQGMMPAMENLGERFAEGVVFLPELLLAGDTMQKALEVLKPALVAEDSGGSKGTLVIGTVEGDIHDLGKNIVKIMVEGAGFNVVDLGTSVSAEKFIEAANKNGADMIGLSALLTNTMAAMEQIVAQVREKTPSAKILIGGAPLTQEFADKIGADGYAPDAHAAVKLCKSVMNAH